jgi:hypothetical protein
VNERGIEDKAINLDDCTIYTVVLLIRDHLQTGKRRGVKRRAFEWGMGTMPPRERAQRQATPSAQAVRRPSLESYKIRKSMQQADRHTIDTITPTQVWGLPA